MKFFWIILSALVCGLCYASYEVGFIAYFAVIPFIYVIMKEADREKKGKTFRFYGYGYLWSFVYFVTVFHWFIYQYPLEYLGFSKGMAVLYIIVACAGTSAVLSLPTGLLPLLYALYSKTKLHKNAPYLSAVFIAATYTVLEWLLSKSSIAVPWARLALTQQSYLKFLQTSSVFGSYFISFIVMLFNALLAYGIFRYVKSGKLKTLGVCACVCVAVFVGNLCAGSVLYAYDAQTEAGTNVTAAALQGNQVSGRSDNLTLRQTLDLYLELATEAVRDGAKLIVMPEGCFSADIDSPYGMVASNLCSFADVNNVTLIFGCFMNEEDSEYNVTYCITPDGVMSDAYKKQHLVPFGEFMPMRDLLIHIVPFLDGITMLDTDLTPGKEIVIFETEDGGIGSLICYDSIFEMLAAKQTQAGADLFAVSTNDSWFMDSAAIYEHNGQSVLRAIENRRYVVRSANSGMSSIINSRGEILTSLGPLIKGYITSDVKYREEMSFYSRFPNLFIIICASYIVASYAVGIVFPIKNKRSKTTI